MLITDSDGLPVIELHAVTVFQVLPVIALTTSKKKHLWIRNPIFMKS